ncbi:MAG: hypothetical protein J6T96_03355 [Bacteroidales bacterium]|nr:hypothetical protein [Bacteroidales bacterium]
MQHENNNSKTYENQYFGTILAQRNVNTLKHHGNHGGVQAAASYFNPLWMAENAFRKGFLFS